MILKSPRYGDPQADQPLPYRIDELRRSGVELAWTDRNLSGLWAWAARTERWTLPWTQALLTRRVRRNARATIAMFESEGHGLALFRLLTGRRLPPLVVIGCWLADLARAGGWRQRLYRQLYRAVDVIVVFSSNQRDTLVELLGIDPDRIHVVPFGVDLEQLAKVPVSDTGTVVAAGRDLGRDWATLVAAARGTGWPVELITRPQQIEALELPPEVAFRGTVDLDSYLAALASASVVVVPTEVREYPTGQTVLLEAMALGKACVVTDTPAMREYVLRDVTGVLVPPGDPQALRVAVDQLLSDPERRHRLGAAARDRALDGGGATAMWGDIGQIFEEFGALGVGRRTRHR